MITLLTVQSIYAGEIEKLVMPGKLVEAHADFEADCDQCHKSFDKTGQSSKCMSCHDHANIRNDINNRSGFHGRIDNIAKIECSTCHSDHKGRDANIINFVTKMFDHNKTDFKLEGRHKHVECGSCHEYEKKYYQAQSKCYSCHKKNDTHKGKLGKKCSNCHSEQSWSRINFDHNKNTDFKLLGKHREVACDLCHINNTYAKTPVDCYTCHYVNDIHNGKLGKKCRNCHSETKWSKPAFDHDKTKFPLKFKHQSLQCASCHKSRKFDDDPGTQCIDCHASGDVHKNRFGNKCAGCHSERGWAKTTFMHNRDTGFELSGKHLGLQCNDCHREKTLAKNSKKTCYDCHSLDDVHRGEQGRRCEQCHSDRGWKDRRAFDHDLTKFPLMGQHAVLSCQACHIDKQFDKAGEACSECHAGSDVHKGRFGRECERCHNPNDWNIWQFDHDKQTDFSLDGAHKDLSCYACHTQRGDVVKVSRTCEGCHRNDDIHNGAFGRQCQRCHSSSSFSKNIRY